MKIAVGVLLVTQLLNLVFVPVLAHAGLALSIGVGALVNAALLLAGLMRRGSYRPEPGWSVFLLQVLAASALLAVFLMWSAGQFSWVALQAQSLQRIGLLAGVLAAAASLYFLALWAAGLKLTGFLQH